VTKLTIVIVNWNGGHLLMRCLASIRASRCSADLDVIVVDNRSSDGSREAAALAFPEFRVIDSGSNLGFGRANNLAAALTDSSVVLFLNPDTELMEDTLEQALRCLDEQPEVGALGCRMLYRDGRVQELGLQWHATPWTVLLELLFITSRSKDYLRRWLPTIDPLRSGHVNKLYGGFMMVRKEILDAAGWFDERYFMYAEDADLSRTILGLGWKLYYCSEASIVHVAGGVTVDAPSTFGFLMKQESVNKLIEKYEGRRAAELHRVAVFVGGLVRLSAVLPCRTIAMLRGNEASIARWKASSLKQRQLLLWSLGLRKASVPLAPSAERA
jgi:hypothetical protein